jgi:REP element-mobilizing transposase RayT
MSRQLRIEYPGAFYHVYSRGNQRQPIFFSDEDRFYFLKILREAHERLGCIVHLYCLMDNHYHITLETPAANLSQIMHFLNTTYSVYLNKKHDRCGHLFQGRFKAILVQADAYAKVLTTYIHGNPVRKKIVERPEHFPWSSCQDYYGLRCPPPWLELDFILKVLGNSRDILKLEHERCLMADHDPTLSEDFEAADRIGILGNDEFIDEIRRKYLRERIDKSDRELNQLAKLKIRPDISEIALLIDRELGSTSRQAKKCTIYIAHKLAGFRLREIGEYFGIGPKAVSESYRRTAKEIESNETLRRVIGTVRTHMDFCSIGAERGKTGKVEV